MLDDYAAAGGSYEEAVIPDCGHVPFITHIEAFDRAFHAHLARTS
jgi:pimeloyl-ACP methyl ester carboxylesterase